MSKFVKGEQNGPNPDTGSDMRRKKKKKKTKCKTKSDYMYAWIKTEPETEPSGVQSEDVDFRKLEDNQTKDAPKKKKKKKKRNVKTEDLVDGASSMDLKMVRDSTNDDSGHHLDGSTPEKKKKRKHKHSVLEVAQSNEMNKISVDSQEKLPNAEEGCPLSIQTKHQSHKLQKKRKRKGLGKLSSSTFVTNEHEADSLLSALSSPTKQTSHKKRKQKAEGDHSSQTSGKEVIDYEIRHNKRKRKAQEDLNKLTNGKHKELNHINSVPESVEHCVPQKKRKKKKDMIDNSQTSGYLDSEIPCSNMNVHERTPEDAYKTYKRKKKKKSTRSKEEVGDEVSTPSSQIRTERRKISRRKQERSNCSEPAKAKILSSTEGESYEATHSKTNSSLEKEVHDPEAASRYSKTPDFGRKAGLSETEEEDEEWVKDLPFHFENAGFCALKDAVRKEGAVMKKGKWSGLEDRILKENVDNFCKKYNIDDAKKVILPGLFDEKVQLAKLLRRHKFFLCICRGLKRLPFDVYLRSRKVCDDRNYKGVFTKEEISNIEKLQKVYGNKWSKIGRRVDRSGQSVMDWYRNRPIEGRRYGKWLDYEKKQLKRAVLAVTELDEEEVIDMLVGIPWRDVYKMVPTRNKSQCMGQWKQSLCWSVGNRAKRDWTPEDSVDLIESVYALDISEESDIDWISMHKKFWERAPSPAKLSLMWYTLKLRHLKNYHFMTFEEILEELYHKVLPVLKERIQKRQAARDRIKSKEFISDTEEDSCSDNEWY